MLIATLRRVGARHLHVGHVSDLEPKKKKKLGHNESSDACAPRRSRPNRQQAHRGSSGDKHHCAPRAVVASLCVGPAIAAKLLGEQLDERDVEEDAGREAVERGGDDGAHPRVEPVRHGGGAERRAQRRDDREDDGRGRRRAQRRCRRGRRRALPHLARQRGAQADGRERLVRHDGAQHRQEARVLEHRRAQRHALHQRVHREPRRQHVRDAGRRRWRVRRGGGGGDGGGEGR